MNENKHGHRELSRPNLESQIWAVCGDQKPLTANRSLPFAVSVKPENHFFSRYLTLVHPKSLIYLPFERYYGIKRYFFTSKYKVKFLPFAVNFFSKSLSCLQFFLR